MAILFNPSLDQRVMLRSLHTWGRHPASCRTVLQASDVSKLHALIRWHHGQWEICDQSRNGTQLDGQRLVAGQWTPLKTLGAVIGFGLDESARWTVQNLDAPATCLFSRQEPYQVLTLSAQENLLPEPSSPEANLYCVEGRWLLDRLDATEILADGDLVRLGAQGWEFVLGAELDATLETRRASLLPLPDLRFDFQVSQNEEHASLDLQVGRQQVALGERIHHYTLATLARKRLEDARQGIPEASQGWVSVEALARMLGVDAPYVNIQIFRARQQILRVLPQSLEGAALLERRRGELRFGPYAFRISKGGREEGVYPPEQRNTV